MASLDTKSVASLGFRHESASMNTFSIDYSAPGQLAGFTLPTFAGGGTITVKITMKFSLIEVAK